MARPMAGLRRLLGRRQGQPAATQRRVHYAAYCTMCSSNHVTPDNLLDVSDRSLAGTGVQCPNHSATAFHCLCV